MSAVAVRSTVLGACLLLACESAASRQVPEVVRAEPGAPVEAYAGAVVLGGGTRLDRVRIEPSPLRAGEPMTIHLRLRGTPLELELGVAPPRSAGRQVVRGGLDAPPAEVPADPRTRTTTVTLGPGEHAVQLALPEPWHARTAMITAAVAAPGRASAPATAGPRTRAGLAILALEPVAPEPTRVVAPWLEDDPTVDGALVEPSWKRAPRVPMVEPLDGEPPSTSQGRWGAAVQLGWSERALFVAARVDDADVWSEFTRADDPLWEADTFEVFVFGDGDRRGYLELQVSPRGVTFDARFSRYRQGDRAWNSRWRQGVEVDGSVARRNDRDRGWTIEAAIPWTEICEHTAVRCPPSPGQTLRLNAFAVDRTRRGEMRALALSPPRVPDFHAPENAAELVLGSSSSASR